MTFLVQGVSYVVSAFRRTVCRRKVHLERPNRKAVECLGDIGSGRVVAFEKESFDGAGTIDHLFDDPQQRDDVGSANPAMHEPGKRVLLADGIERANVGRRSIADNRHQPLDRLEHARHPAKRQRRRAEADHLAIVGTLVAADNLNRIGRRIGVVELRVQPIQRVSQQ